MRQSSTDRFANTQSKYWCFTINNPKDNYADVYGAKNWSYMIIGNEVGDEGTPHLQGFVAYNTRVRFSTVKKQLPRAHIEEMMGTTHEAIEYCKKEGNWEEYGEVPPNTGRKGGSAGGKKKMERYKEAIKLARAGDFDKMEEDHPDMYWNNYHTMKRIRMDNPKLPEALQRLDNEWIWGEPGIGKSRAAREENPGCYIKLHNKWWLGYQGEEVVLYDDLDRSEAQWIGAFLKTWADHYPFPAETKGDGMVIRPRRIIVTSNYSIEDLFGHDEDLCAALRRRFKVRNMIQPFQGLYADHSMHSEEEMIGDLDLNVPIK